MVTVPCVWLGYELNRVGFRKSLITQVCEAGGLVVYNSPPTWRSRYFGDVEIEQVTFSVGFAEKNYDLLIQAKKSFPRINFYELRASKDRGEDRPYNGKNGEFTPRK